MNADSTNASSYDQIPYPSFSFPESHPRHLAIIAGLFGLQTALPAKASVLELGCASGGNLIPMAYGMPQARCVGVDLSARQIEIGQALVTKAGLKNVDLRCMNLADLDKTFGTFDYIICHGVFSWVPAEVQKRILEICSANLSPQGVAYVSYNTLPGWNMYRSIRDMMLFHTRQFNEPAMIVGQARAFLDFAVKAVAQQQSAYSMLLKGELERLRTQSDAYLFHDHLEKENNPVYFHEFARMAEAQGLRYLGESTFHTMTPVEFDPEIQKTLHAITDKIVAMEQYIDFLRNRTFRATLLCRRDNKLVRRIAPAAIQKLQVATALQSVSQTPEVWSATQENYVHPNGSELRTTDALTKAVLFTLKDSWPGWQPFERLLKTVREAALKSPLVKTLVVNEENLGRAVLQLFQQGMVELHLDPPQFVTKVAVRPKVSALVRAQIQEGRPLTNLRHETVQVPDLFRYIAGLCDGKRDSAQIASALEEGINSGVLKMREGKELPTVPADRLKYFSGVVANALAFLARSAMLQA
ncbi:MAG: class I SAM-dependent methyltransferase [Deltaproteobacteria bacterium]|nr:class I SAM-dependent methyltransferase [Deltaproteobacteria bacterium]